MTLRRAPTLLAILDYPGGESGVAGGILATSAWRGVRTALVMLRGGEEPATRLPAGRAAMLLGVRNHFHWESGGEERVTRLARVLRALQPTILLSCPATAAVAEEAWSLASRASHSMPGLEPFSPQRARLWLISDDGPSDARVDVRAAAPLLRAVRDYYARDTAASDCAGHDPVPAAGYLKLRHGVPLSSPGPVTDLFAGLPNRPERPPIISRAEEIY